MNSKVFSAPAVKMAVLKILQVGKKLKKKTHDDVSYTRPIFWHQSCRNLSSPWNCLNEDKLTKKYFENVELNSLMLERRIIVPIVPKLIGFGNH